MPEYKQPRSVFLTGASSGLGLGFAGALLEKGIEVQGASRRTPENLDSSLYTHCKLDLSRLDQIEGVLSDFYRSRPLPDWLILNGGILNPIADMKDTSLQTLKRVMDVNTWANKPILDFFLSRDKQPEFVLAISSGAAVSGSRGWNGYSISKAALNMLIKLYSEEAPHTHMISLAPGLVMTAMQKQMDLVKDPARFPAVERLFQARNTPHMPGPSEAASKILNAVPQFFQHQSGSFLDIRKL